MAEKGTRDKPGHEHHENALACIELVRKPWLLSSHSRRQGKLSNVLVATLNLKAMVDAAHALRRVAKIQTAWQVICGVQAQEV